MDTKCQIFKKYHYSLISSHLELKAWFFCPSMYYWSFASNFFLFFHSLLLVGNGREVELIERKVESVRSSVSKKKSRDSLENVRNLIVCLFTCSKRARERWNGTQSSIMTGWRCWGSSRQKWLRKESGIIEYWNGNETNDWCVRKAIKRNDDEWEHCE